MASENPYWSVMIPTYNRALVRAAIASVLAQDRGPEAMHIEVVDNGSTEVDTERIVQQEGKGRVAFHRNERNLGLIGNLNQCVERARGQWVHILHDDDLVFPGYYEAMEAAGRATSPDGRHIGAAFCRAAYVDLSGKWLSTLDEEFPAAGIYPGFETRSFHGNAILFPAMAVRKTAYDRVGPFDAQLTYSSDWFQWVKIAQQFAVWYEPRILAGYRSHDAMTTAGMKRSGADIAGLKLALSYFPKVLPNTREVRVELREIAEHMGRLGINNARESLQKGDLFGALCQLREGLRGTTGIATLRDLEEGVMRFWDQWERTTLAAIQAFPRDRAAPTQVATIQALRRHLADQILDFDETAAPEAWITLRKLFNAFVQVGVADVEPPENELAWVQELNVHLRADPAGDKWPQQMAAAVLYLQPHELPMQLTLIPNWLIGEYLMAVAREPARWRPGGSRPRHVEILQQMRREAANLTRLGDIWKQVEAVLANRLKELDVT